MSNWEERYQTRDTPWDKGGPHPALTALLVHEPVRGRVLVPGSGHGHDVRALAQTAEQVVGIDIAPSAVAATRALPVAGGERYEVADLFALPPEMRGAFDWVWEHTCFCAIDPARRGDYAGAVASALRPGGHLLAVFYLDPGNARPDEGPPFETTLGELDRLFLPYFDLIREWPPAQTYAGREGREWMRLMRRKG
jgi:SAM-dependent methyltransferase